VDGDWNPIAAIIEPDESNREVYAELYGLYRELYPATRPQAHALAGLEKSFSRETSRR
jgi:xylulokinase